MGSERMLRRVFENLIQNALDALMPGGSIVLTTFCDQARFTVEVADTGSGIAAKNIAKIFEPFFTTKKRIERRGTGLGLAICYNVIKQHNGEIAVSSKEGQGTKFVITLPPAS
jgi:signal transduction histidine kinase